MASYSILPGWTLSAHLILFLLQFPAQVFVDAQAINAGPCYNVSAPCYVFAVNYNACGGDYTCLCGGLAFSKTCGCGALHQFAPACISCLNDNSQDSDTAYGLLLNSALGDCIGINGTNAVVQSLAASTSLLVSLPTTGPITATTTNPVISNGAAAVTSTATVVTSSRIDYSEATVTVTAGSSSNKLSGGAIGGIVGGAVGGTLVLAALLLFCVCVRRRNPDTSASKRSNSVGNEGKGLESSATLSAPSDLEVAGGRPVRYPDNIESAGGRTAINTEVMGGRLAGGY